MLHVRRWAGALALALLLCAVALAPEPLAAGSAASKVADAALPTVYYAAPDGDCGGRSPCYRSVQEAINALPAGGEVRLAAGRYTGVARMGALRAAAIITKPLTLSGGFTPANWDAPDPAAHAAILDAANLGRVVVISDTAHVTLQGLTLTGGVADGQGGAPMAGQDAGGGLYLSNVVSVTLRHNTILSNTADLTAGQAGWGGGLFAQGCEGVALQGNALRTNSANAHGPGYGGGVYIGDSDGVALRGNVIQGNTAGAGNGVGGGLYLTRCPGAALEGNALLGNTASISGEGRGGGAYVANSARIAARGNRAENNVASVDGRGYGGGVYLLGGPGAVWENLLAVGNMASARSYQPGYGGGVYLVESDALFANAVLVENEATEAGGGVYAAGASPRFLHATLKANRGAGGAVRAAADPGGFISSRVAMTNTLIAGHEVGAVGNPGSPITLHATLWHDNDRPTVGDVASSADYEGDPAFEADGYRLTFNSAARGRGVASEARADCDGQPRTACGGYDLGADELMCVAAPAVMR